MNVNNNCFALSRNPFAAGELGNAVQDAFVIAVEQQARERLQRLSALKRVTPVDMSQLSIKVRTTHAMHTQKNNNILIHPHISCAN